MFINIYPYFNFILVMHILASKLPSLVCLLPLPV